MNLRFDCLRARGFSLLELLVVMVILGLLVGLVGPRLFTKVDESRIQTAAAQVKMLRGAVETLRLDLRRIPTTDEGLALLTRPPADPAAAKSSRGSRRRAVLNILHSRQRDRAPRATDSQWQRLADWRTTGAIR